LGCGLFVFVRTAIAVKSGVPILDSFSNVGAQDTGGWTFEREIVTLL